MIGPLWEKADRDKRNTINILVLAQAGLTVCFVICAFSIAGNANAGFNAVLTAILYILYVLYLGYTFNKKRQVDGGSDTSIAIRPVVGGVLIGMTTMFIFLSLMTAIYWGEYSHCEKGTDITGYSCISASGMAATAWFASFLLIVESVTLTLMVKWKDDLFDAELGYEDFGVGANDDLYGSDNYAYDGQTGLGGPGLSAAPTEADL